MNVQSLNKQVTNRDNTIDFIRGIGIVMIFFVHYGQAFGNPLFTKIGQMGCQAFFFASGYTCSISFKKNPNIKDFYKKRYISLAYGYYTILAITVLANIIFKLSLNIVFLGTNTDPISIICNILMIHGLLPFCNNNVFPGGWFVGTIVIMYLLHPLAVKIYEKKTNRRWIITALLTVSATGIAIILNYSVYGHFSISNNSFFYFIFLNQIGCYFIGMALSYSDSNIHLERIPSFALVVLSGIALVCCFYLEGILSFSFAPILASLFFFFLYLYLNGRNNHKNKIQLFISILGINSFYIYLTHMIVIKIVARGLKWVFSRIGFNNVFALFLVILLPTAIAIYVASRLLKKIIEIEQNAIRMRRLP